MIKPRDNKTKLYGIIFLCVLFVAGLLMKHYAFSEGVAIGSVMSIGFGRCVGNTGGRNGGRPNGRSGA